jgi:hypothetical protein
MPQQLSNLAQRSALAEHLSSQSMTKLVRPFGSSVNAGTFERMSNDGSNPTRPEKGSDRRFGTQEYTPTAACGPSVPQISGDRSANLSGQGHGVAPAAFAAHAHLSRVPVDVIQFEICHFT